MLLRFAGVGVVGGDLMRSENDLLRSVRRKDFAPRSADPTSVMDLPFLSSGESSGLFSVIVPSEFVPGVRGRFEAGVIVLYFSFGLPKCDW